MGPGQGDQKASKKIRQVFQKIAQKVAKSNKTKISTTKQFESPKQLQQTTFEALKHLQQTTFEALKHLQQTIL